MREEFTPARELYTVVRRFDGPRRGHFGGYLRVSNVHVRGNGQGSVHVGWRIGLVRAQCPRTASKLHSGAKIRKRQSVENRKQKERLPRGKKGACLVPSSDMVKREEHAFATIDLSQLPSHVHICTQHNPKMKPKVQLNSTGPLLSLNHLHRHLQGPTLVDISRPSRLPAELKLESSATSFPTDDSATNVVPPPWMP